MSDRFGHLVRAEWTKFRSVRRWVLGLLIAIGLTVVLSTLFASVGGTDANSAPAVADRFHFVHQPMTGDGSVVARVSGQEPSHDWAKAGVMIKQSTASGSPYAAILVTPRNGVRFQADFRTDIGGSGRTAPLWLKLTRSGTTIIGYESADGTTWTEVGSVSLSLPQTVEAGMFVASPEIVEIQRQFGGTSIGGRPTLGRATFDNASVSGGEPAKWQHEDIGASMFTSDETGATESGGTFTVSGSGEIIRLQQGDDDLIFNSFTGVVFGLMAVIVVAVLFITSGFKRGMIRTTFAASPRRGRVLVAKALVIGLVTFVAGLAATAGAFLLSQPQFRANGYRPPAYPYVHLFDGVVMRAVVGGALFLALLAVLSLGIGAILRRSAGAIALLIAIFIVPQILFGGLPLNVALWVGRVTPVAGLAIMQTTKRWDTAIDPWPGLGVLAGYAALAMGVAIWQVRRRDA